MTARTLSLADLEDITAPEGPPSRTGLFGELGTALQPLRLAAKSARLAAAPRGDGRTAVVLPGWRAPESSTLPIRAYLNKLGHNAQSWGLGVNLGDVEGTRDRLAPRIEALAEVTGRPVNLLGWSLGGVVAREVARVLPDSVHRIVTYGSPILGGPTHTIGAANFGVDECERITELQEHLDRIDPIRTPVTAAFTRNDNIVDWRACIDRSSLDVTMVEVQSTHVGLGIDPDVWLVAANALAE